MNKTNLQENVLSTELLRFSYEKCGELNYYAFASAFALVHCLVARSGAVSCVLCAAQLVCWFPLLNWRSTWQVHFSNYCSSALCHVILTINVINIATGMNIQLRVYRG